MSDPVLAHGRTHGQPPRASSHLKHNVFKHLSIFDICVSVTGLYGL